MIKKPQQEESVGTILPSIIRAAYEGDYGMVAYLLQEGHDVNSVDAEDNLSLLHIAALQGDRQLAEVVLAHNEKYHDVDFTIKSLFRPRLAWQFAMNANQPELARLIDQAGMRQRRARDRSP